MKIINYDNAQLLLSHTDIITIVYSKDDGSVYMTVVGTSEIYDSIEKQNIEIIDCDITINIKLNTQCIIIKLLPVHNFDILKQFTEQINILQNEITELRNVMYDIMDIRCIRDNEPLPMHTSHIKICFTYDKIFKITNDHITISHGKDLLFTRNMLHMKCTTLTFNSDLNNITFNWSMLPLILKTININSKDVTTTFFDNITNIHNNIEEISFTNTDLSVEELNILIDKWPKIKIYYNNKLLSYEKIEIDIL